MSEFKGTPGKWYIDPLNPEREKELYVESPSGLVVATLFCEPMDEETRANAKAIAQVPIFIEALQLFTDWAENQSMWDKCGQSYYKAKAALSAALD